MRKPADKDPGVRQQAWDAIRDRTGWFEVRHIHGLTKGVRKEGVRAYLKGLAKAGILERRVQGCVGCADGYRLVGKAGREAPRVRADGTLVTQGRATAQLWSTIRMIRRFSLVELAAMASTEETAIPLETARSYVAYLRKADFVRLRQERAPGRAERYVFARSKDPGPKAPMIQRVKQVYDPNSGQVVWRGEPRA